MARIARVAVADVPYHVTQRGNGRQQVFFGERDYRLYLDLLGRHCEENELSVWAYCLMSNHVHLVVVPKRDTSMARVLGRTHGNFARHYNLQARSCGHVWQARYFSTPLDAGHLWQAMAYVERNPVRAGIVQKAEQYEWSSAFLRMNEAGGGGTGLVDLMPWRTDHSWSSWKRVLDSTTAGEEAFGRRLQDASRRGRPLGDDGFIKQLESRCGRRLRARPVGRPREWNEGEREQSALGFGI